MAVTPIEIENQRFDVRVRGFDRAQVKAFLGTLAEETAALIAERNLLKEETVALKGQLERAAEREKRVQETVLALHDLSQKMKEDAQRESELVVREARFMAAKILENARSEAVQIEGQISQMRIERDTFDDRLRMLLDEHQRLLIQRRQDTELRGSIPFRNKWLTQGEQ